MGSPLGSALDGRTHALDATGRNGVRIDGTWIHVSPEPMARFDEDIQKTIAGVRVWQRSRNRYDRTPSGRIVTQWPFSMTECKKRTSTLEEGVFEVQHRVG